MAEDLHAELAKKYSLKSAAEALLFKADDDEPSFLLEIITQGWEFSDGSYIGTVLKGTFYYNRGLFRERLSKNSVTKADYYVDHKREQGELFLHIQFFEAGSTAELLGEFLAEDEVRLNLLSSFLSRFENYAPWHNVAGSTGLLQRRKEGEWRKVEYIIANATVFKTGNDTNITIKCKAGGKVVELKCNAGDKIYENVIDDVYGRFFIGNLDALHKATSVSWYHNHVVFHEDKDAKDFSAFFLADDPEEPPEDPHLQCSLGSYCHKSWESVEWKDI